MDAAKKLPIWVRKMGALQNLLKGCSKWRKHTHLVHLMDSPI